MRSVALSLLVIAFLSGVALLRAGAPPQQLRTLQPFDKEAIFASVEKTSRALIVHEDVKTLGIGAELSAVIMEERFDHLDAPVLRVSRHIP